MKAIKLIMVFALMLFLIGNVSAILETKSFNKNVPQHGQIEINDWLGISNKADYRLTDYDASLINVWAEGEVHLYKNTHLFTGIFYKDVIGKEGNLEDVKFFIWTTENYKQEHKHYVEKCVEDRPGHEECAPVYNHSTFTKEERSYWKPYVKNTNLPEGDYKWRFEAKRRPNKPIDFILEAHGKTFDEWAWFNSSWDYCRDITLTDNAGVSWGYTHPVKINITGMTLTKAEEIRIVEGACGSAVEEQGFDILDNDTSAGWVNVEFVANISKTYSVYYGNPTASAYTDSSDANFTSSTSGNVWIIENSLIKIGSDNGEYLNTWEYTTTPGATKNNVYAGSNGWNTHVDDGSSGSAGSGADQQAPTKTSDTGVKKTITMEDRNTKTNTYDFTWTFTSWANYPLIEFNTTTDHISGSGGMYNVYTTSWSGAISVPADYSCAKTGGYSTDTWDCDSGGGVKWADNYETENLLTYESPGSNSADSFGAIILYQDVVASSGGTNDEPGRVQYSSNGLHGVTGVWTRRSNTPTSSATGTYDGRMLIGFIESNATELWADYARIWTNEPTATIGEEQNANGLNINLISPVNYYNSSSQDVTFECNATDESGVLSLNLTINGSVYHTETGDGTTNLTLSSMETLSDGFYNWYCTANDDTDTENSSTRYLTIDSTEPTLSLNEPTENETTSTLPINITLNVTSSDAHLDTCWYFTNENATNTTYTCNSTTNISFSNEGEYTITYCANDTLGNENCGSVSNTIFYYTYSQSASQNSIGEGDSVTFNLYVNMTNTPETNAVLNINNTEYSSVSKYEFTNYTYFSKAITIPDGWGNSTGNIIDWYWTFNISGVTNENTTTQNITIYEVAIDDCGSYGTRILNYTLYDEETKSNTLPTPLGNQSIEVDVLIESYDNSSLSWDYSKKETGTNTMDICVPNGLLNNSNYVLGVVTRFKADDHVVEFHYIDNFNLSIDNIPQDISLYDLYTGTERSEYSTSFLVNYQDEYYLPVQDAVIDLLRYYVDEGEYISVENAKTDVDGNTRLHLVTEDVRYYAIVKVEGQVVYTSPTFLALCQATPCQINFQKQNDVTPTNQTTIENLNYQVTLDQDTRIVEMTYSSNDGSSINVEMNVTEWDNYENNTICTDSATSSGGTLSCSVPLTATNSTYIVSIAKNGESLPTYTFDLKPSAYDTFGYTGVFLTGLLYLTLVLMAVSSGPIAVVVFGLLGIIFAGMLNIFSGGSIIGVGASLMWLIIAGVIIIIKASSRRSGG